MSDLPVASPANAERLRLITAVTEDAANFLGLDPESEEPAVIVAAVDAAIVRTVFGEATEIPEGEAPDLLLGCLWGAQMVRELGWSWTDMRSGEAMDVAVVSPDGDMAIYPFTFVAECLARQRVCTVALSFNMLRERKGEAIFEPQSYEDVMSHIRHIVPPYELG